MTQSVPIFLCLKLPRVDRRYNVTMRPKYLYDPILLHTLPFKSNLCNDESILNMLS